MKYGAFLSSFIIFISLSAFGCEGDKKRQKSSDEIELSCTQCNTYLLTMRGSFIGKGMLPWELITKPSRLVMATDVSKYLPISSLPAIYCAACKEICCEPVWHARADSLKAVYKVIAAHHKGK